MYATGDPANFTVKRQLCRVPRGANLQISKLGNAGGGAQRLLEILSTHLGYIFCWNPAPTRSHPSCIKKSCNMQPNDALQIERTTGGS